MVIRVTSTIAALAILLTGACAMAENSVTVESKTVCVGEKGVAIGVSVKNDMSVRHLSVPLEIRSEKDGAFIQNLKIAWGGRLPVGRGLPLADNVFNNQYHKKDCQCLRTTSPGYGTVTHSDTLPHPVAQSPVGMLFSRFRFTGAELAPGRDSTVSSINLTVDIGTKTGTIMIDTTCACPSHTLMFIHGSNPIQQTMPLFTPGVITVKRCGDGK